MAAAQISRQLHCRSKRDPDLPELYCWMFIRRISHGFDGTNTLKKIEKKETYYKKYIEIMGEDYTYKKHITRSYETQPFVHVQRWSQILLPKYKVQAESMLRFLRRNGKLRIKVI